MKKVKKPLFNIGDTVRIKDEFWNYNFFHEPGIVQEMKECSKSKHIILYCYPMIENNRQHYCYNLEKEEEKETEPYWKYTWDESWLEFVTPDKNIEINEDEIMNMF